MVLTPLDPNDRHPQPQRSAYGDDDYKTFRKADADARLSTWGYSLRGY